MAENSKFNWGTEWAGTDRGKAFLGAFKDDFANRQKRTDAAQSGSGSGNGGININTGGSKSAPGMSKLAPDIHLQQGYRPGEWTMPGTPGKKGFAGTLMRGVGAAVGPIGAVVGNVAAGASGADYWYTFLMIRSYKILTRMINHMHRSI